ncbi:hypothetical protein C8R46DRAFT_1011163 [Mycena filopes]|nr:hypothetical protein C8R46DRAFT_1011163 [Mycena filopes]
MLSQVDLADASLDSAGLEAHPADGTLLTSIETQISHLARTPSQLRMARESVQARVARQSPVITLPTETVSEIFNHFLPAYPLCPPLLGRSSPTALTHICHQWREIALGTPALWRAIEFDLSDDEALPSGIQADIGNGWLERSRSCPLSIKIRSGDDRNIYPMVNTLVPHHGRWEHLDVDRLDLCSRLSGPTPLLRSLLVTAQGCPSFRAIPWLDAPLARRSGLAQRRS